MSAFHPDFLSAGSVTFTKPLIEFSSKRYFACQLKGHNPSNVNNQQTQSPSTGMKNVSAVNLQCQVLPCTRSDPFDFSAWVTVMCNRAVRRVGSEPVRGITTLTPMPLEVWISCSEIHEGIDIVNIKINVWGRH